MRAIPAIDMAATGRNIVSLRKSAGLTVRDLQAIFGFETQPRYFDASDALAVAYTCFMEQSDPMGDLRRELKPRRAHKSRKQQWADFVNQNPERVGSTDGRRPSVESCNF